MVHISGDAKANVILLQEAVEAVLSGYVPEDEEVLAGARVPRADQALAPSILANLKTGGFTPEIPLLLRRSVGPTLLRGP
ncbi:hypothetical protein U1Q18_028002 [Sarracenia purpurea var. burkii]